jgi:O-antigen ligase
VASGVALTLLMFSGHVKASPVLAWLPVDLTAVALLLVGGAVGLTLLWKKPVAMPVGGFLILAALVPGFLVGTDNPTTPHDRVSILISIYTAVSAFWLLRSAESRRVLLWSMTAGGILILPLLQTGTAGTLSVDGQGATISAARMLGVSILILLVLGMSGRIRGRVSKFLAAAVVVVLGYALIGTGSRGPTLAFALALMAAVLIVRRDLVKRVAIAAVLVVLAWVALLVAGDTGAERLRGAAFAGGDLGNSPRVVLWKEALAAMPTLPEGCGWGNFWSVLTPGARLDSGYSQHAHDIVLEAFVEGGWVAGLAVTAFIALALRRQLWSTHGNPHEAALFAVALFMVAISMVSGTLGDDRAMFAILAAAFAVPNPRRSQTRTQRPGSAAVGHRSTVSTSTKTFLASAVELSVPPRWVRPPQ